MSDDDLVGSAPLEERDPFYQPGRRHWLSPIWMFVGGLGGLLVVFLLIGLALPGRWESEREIVIAAAPGDVFPLISDLRGWDHWTSWPDQVTGGGEGPAGAGAVRTWDDRQLGSGTLTVIGVVPEREVAYHVTVDDGSIEIDGLLRIEATPSGTTVMWSERGVFGWNPLLGWMALGMSRLQGAEMEKSLERLRSAALAGLGPDDPPLPAPGLSGTAADGAAGPPRLPPAGRP